MIPDVLPRDLQALLIFLVVSLNGVLMFLIRSVVKSLDKINDTLGNHFTEDTKSLKELSGHMAAQTELARLLLEEVRARREDKESRR